MFDIYLATIGLLMIICVWLFFGSEWGHLYLIHVGFLMTLYVLGCFVDHDSLSL